MYGPAVSFFTYFCVAIRLFMVVMQTPYIIKFLKEISHSIVSIEIMADNIFHIKNIHYPSIIGKEWTSVSKAAKDLIKKMLVKVPGNRATASEALNDPWIRSFHRGKSDPNSGGG